MPALTMPSGAFLLLIMLLALSSGWLLRRYPVARHSVDAVLVVVLLAGALGWLG